MNKNIKKNATKKTTSPKEEAVFFNHRTKLF
jgi:hypothetical protein